MEGNAHDVKPEAICEKHIGGSELWKHVEGLHGEIGHKWFG